MVYNNFPLALALASHKMLLLVPVFCLFLVLGGLAFLLFKKIQIIIAIESNKMRCLLLDETGTSFRCRWFSVLGRMRLLPEKSLAREEIEKMSEIEIKLLTLALDHKHKARRRRCRYIGGHSFDSRLFRSIARGDTLPLR